MTLLRKTAAILIAAPLLLSSLSAFAAPHEGKHNRCDWKPQHVFRELGLTSTQKQELSTLRKEAKVERHADAQSMRQENHLVREKIARLIAQTDFNKTEAEALLQEQANLRIQHQLKNLEVRHKAFNVLTPEQKAKYETLRTEKMEHCADMLKEKAKRLEQRASELN